nr:uncharacterized protein LOC111419721 [Onthophagus taurus]
MHKSNKAAYYTIPYEAVYQNIDIKLNLPCLDYIERAGLGGAAANGIFEQYVREEWPDHIIIFTDGSVRRNPDAAGYGIYSIKGEIEEAHGLTKYMSIFAAEMQAICRSLDIIKMKRWGKVIICSDSLSALKAISNIVMGAQCHYLLIKVLKILSELSNNHQEVILVWVPSHCGIIGNERADELAKSGLDLQPEQIKPDFLDICRYYKGKIFETWSKEWEESSLIKGRWYAQIQNEPTKKNWFESYPPASRYFYTLMSRLRTNQATTENYLY